MHHMWRVVKPNSDEFRSSGETFVRVKWTAVLHSCATIRKLDLRFICFPSPPCSTWTRHVTANDSQRKMKPRCARERILCTDTREHWTKTFCQQDREKCLLEEDKCFDDFPIKICGRYCSFFSFFFSWISVDTFINWQPYGKRFDKLTTWKQFEKACNSSQLTNAKA